MSNHPPVPAEAPSRAPREPGQAEVVMQFAAVVTRAKGESDAALLDRVERAARDLVETAPFSGFEGVRFYPGPLWFDTKESACTGG